jgi:arylsulfatase A-like enzyme
MLDSGAVLGADPRLVRGSHVFLRGEARATLTAAKPFPPALRCEPGEKGSKTPCVASFPLKVPPAPAVIVARRETPAERRGEGQPHATADGSVPAAPPWRALVLRRGESAPAGDLDRIEIILTQTFAAPALRDRARTAEPLAVPANAVLRLSIGVEEAAWHVDSAPVLFRVEMIDEAGNTQDLFRRVLDPARRPEDRRWFDSDVDLSDLAGRTIRLRFVTEPTERDDPRPSLPLWGDPRVIAPVDEESRPSIVLVSLDTLRAKSMSAYGYGLDTTPHIGALAAQGALFEHAFTTFSNTLPSHMSMLTGLYPATHGVGVGPGSGRAMLDARHGTLADSLRAAGYATAAFTENALLDARLGFLRGFSTYDENTAISHGAGDIEATFGRALEWAGRHSDESFFLFAHTYEVHWPYEPREAYQGLFGDPEAKHSGDQHRAYEQEIRYTDDVLQRFVDGLRRVVPDRDLLLIITADHGEEFQDHGLFTHHQLYEEVMRIPLVMVWAGRIAPGTRVAAPVSLVDLPPTILDLAGVPVPPGLDGVSLVPLLSGQTTTLGRAAVFGEYPRSALVPEHHFVARAGDTKCFLSASGSKDFCFDLRADPDERAPHPSQSTTAFADLHAQGDAYRKRALAARPPARARKKPAHAGAHADTAGAQPRVPDELPPVDEVPDDADPVKRKLRALGYVE